MEDLRDLYQEVIMDHNSRPRNFQEIQNPDRVSEGFNPLCGDQVTIYVNLGENNVITEIGFQGVGCAISKASASMMTEAVKNGDVQNSERAIEAFRHMITNQGYDAEILGDAELMSGVSQYPARIKCAALSWHTLKAALDNDTDGKITTE